MRSGYIMMWFYREWLWTPVLIGPRSAGLALRRDSKFRTCASQTANGFDCIQEMSDETPLARREELRLQTLIDGGSLITTSSRGQANRVE
jgi:hypothetical protein